MAAMTGVQGFVNRYLSRHDEDLVRDDVGQIQHGASVAENFKATPSNLLNVFIPDGVVKGALAPLLMLAFGRLPSVRNVGEFLAMGVVKDVTDPAQFIKDLVVDPAMHGIAAALRKP